MTTLVGCYVGNPHGNAPAAMDAYERSLAAFTEATGVAPNCMNAFCSDDGKGAAAAVEQMGWTAWSWSQSPTARKMVPVVGVPMLFTGDQAPQIYEEIAASKYDATWRGIANAWATHGFSKVYFRVGWEHNGSFFAWGTHNLDKGGLEAWKKAWRHIASQLRSATTQRRSSQRSARSIDVRICWNPGFTSWEPVPWQNTYPGDDVVDVIALDFYAGALYPVCKTEAGYYDWRSKQYVPLEQWLLNPDNRWHYWLWPGANEWAPKYANNACGLEELREFANAHGKKIALGECGSGVDPRYSQQSLHDDEWWVQFVRYEVLPQAPEFLLHLGHRSPRRALAVPRRRAAEGQQRVASGPRAPAPGALPAPR